MPELTLTQTIHKIVDDGIAATIAQHPEATITCGKGCFACCREPVYADSEEVREIVEGLTAQQKEEVRRKLLVWMRKFHANHLHKEKEVSTYRYRPLMLWCPLLSEDGTCSVYKQRPDGCRMHLAKTPRIHCEDDDKRREAKFIMIPQLIEYSMRQQIALLPAGSAITYDHLCILLFNTLTDRQIKTAAYMRISKTNEQDLTVEGRDLTDC